MNIFEYLTRNDAGELIFDECGNVYIEGKKGLYDLISSFEKNHVGYGNYYFTKEEYEQICEYEIMLPENWEGYKACVKYPYYRMRGKPVSKKQALDIIRRTDRGMDRIRKVKSHEDFIQSINFDNCLFENWLMNHGSSHGWIHPDGTVGINSDTARWPKEMEFVCEWFNYLKALPYLDVVIAVTCWNNHNPRCDYEELKRDYTETAIFDEEFYDAVDVGIYVHDKTIQILDKKEAVEKYKEYCRLYEKDRYRYMEEHYNALLIDESYFKKCIESYGFTLEDVFKKLRKRNKDL